MACLNTCTSTHELLRPILDRLGVDCLNNIWLPPSQHIVANIGQVGHAGGGGVDCLTLWRRQSAQTQQVLAEITLRSIHEFGNGVSANSCLFFLHRPQ